MLSWLYDKPPYKSDADLRPIARVSSTVVGVFTPT